MGIELAIAAALGGGTFATAAAAFIVNTVVSVALGALASALAPKPKTPNLSGSFSAKAAGVTQNIRQPVTVRRILYGEARIGGALTFIETTDSDKFMHMVLVLADHEVEEIGEVWLNDVSIPADYIDGSGDVIDGTFSGKVRIKKHLGSPTQVADTDLVSETSATSAFRGRGVAYIYIKLEFDRDVFPSSVPTVTAWTKGKKILDPRDATTRWTANGALLSYDYLTIPLDDLTPGVGVAATSIDETYLNASSNICEELVTTTNISETVSSVDDATDIITLSASKLQYQTGDRVTLTTTGTLPAGLSLATNYFVIPYQRKTNPRILLATTLANALAGTAIDLTDVGSGTHTVIKNAEPRYFGGGVIETNEETRTNLDDLLTTMGGSAIYVGGEWKLKAGSYNTPVFEFDEDHLTGPVTIRTKHSRRERFNLIKGVYVSPINDGEPADYPAVTNATYVTNDNGKTLPIDFDLPMTQRPHTAMRLAKIKLERHRQELFFEASFNLHAMQVQPGDVVNITNTRMGWSTKPFEVIAWTLDSTIVNKVPMYSVKMSLQETASTVYDWNNGEETQVDPAPDTNLPDPLVVNPPTTLSVTPIEVRTLSGDLTYDFLVDWVASSTAYVTIGGHYEVQFKKSTETDWRTSFRANDGDTDILVKSVEPGINYDARVRAVSYLGVRSAYQSLFGFTVDSPSGATIVFDYGAITVTAVDVTDFDSITDLSPDTLDFGDIT